MASRWCHRRPDEEEWLLVVVATRNKLDQVCAEALDLERAAVTEEEPGSYLEAIPEGERVVTHLFECQMAGHQGWRWAVTVAGGPRWQQARLCVAVRTEAPPPTTVGSSVPTTAAVRTRRYWANSRVPRSRSSRPCTTTARSTRSRSAGARVRSRPASPPSRTATVRPGRRPAVRGGDGRGRSSRPARRSRAGSRPGRSTARSR